jgi:hypothetical protein
VTTAAYLQDVISRGAMLRSTNPTVPESVSGLGEVVTAGNFLAGGDELVSLASQFPVELRPVPPMLDAVDTQAVLASDLADWLRKAEAVVIRAEQDAGVPVGGSSATERITASNRVEDSIRSSMGVVMQAASAVLPDSVAPKVASKDLALSLRRQYNSVNAGILAHTPQGVGLLLSAGTSPDDIQRDYLHRMMVCQAIVKLGEQNSATAASGLGFLFLLAPMMIIAAVVVIGIIATAIVGTIYITQRNAVWSDVMGKCASQQTTSQFCSDSLKAFKEEPPWTMGAWFKENMLWIGVGGLFVIYMLKKKS